MLRVLIADDHRIFAQSLSAVLTNSEVVKVVGIVANGRMALDKLADEEIDILLTDLHMPGMGGIALTLSLRAQFPKVKVLILSMVDDPGEIREAVHAGIDGYLLKNVDIVELVDALLTIEKGQSYFQPDVFRKLLETPIVSTNGISYDLKALTSRELDVLRLVAKEHSSNQIAEKLFISLNTVETHRKNLFKKLSVKNSLGLIKFALKHGLVE